MDTSLRVRERAASAGDVHAQAALLRARVRAGEVTSEAVALAAYCWDEAARLVLKPHATIHNPWCPCDLGKPFGPHTDCCENKAWNVERWLRGLERWGREALVRAALAAAWEALNPSAHEGCEGAHLDGLDCAAVFSSLEASEAWLRDPSEERLEAWRLANVAAGSLDWIPLAAGGRHVRRTDSDDYAARVRAAAGLVGSEEVRAAICRRLVAWAIGGGA
jgi:hypothetical protein